MTQSNTVNISAPIYPDFFRIFSSMNLPSDIIFFPKYKTDEDHDHILESLIDNMELCIKYAFDMMSIINIHYYMHRRMSNSPNTIYIPYKSLPEHLHDDDYKNKQHIDILVYHSDKVSESINSFIEIYSSICQMFEEISWLEIIHPLNIKLFQYMIENYVILNDPADLIFATKYYEEWPIVSPDEIDLDLIKILNPEIITI